MAKPQDPSTTHGRRLRIGGVPEHFNYLFKLAEKNGLYKKQGVDVEFVVKKCGTGQMIQSLKEKDVDLVVALTEGLVSDIARRESDIRILGTYVNSPLCWAVSTGTESNIKNIDDLRDKTFGISRYGSGSHLMAHVMAMQNKWEILTSKQFQVCGDFKSLRDSVNHCIGSPETDAFLWETFTTKPFHDSGEVRRVGDISTPWPCFMIAGLKSTLDESGEMLAAVKAALASINEAASLFREDESKTIVSTIAEEYGMQLEDAQTWYDGVDITAHRFVSQKALETTLRVLCDAGVLQDCSATVNSLIDERVCELLVDS